MDKKTIIYIVILISLCGVFFFAGSIGPGKRAERLRSEVGELGDQLESKTAELDSAIERNRELESKYSDLENRYTEMENRLSIFESGLSVIESGLSGIESGFSETANGLSDDIGSVSEIRSRIQSYIDQTQ